MLERSSIKYILFIHISFEKLYLCNIFIKKGTKVRKITYCLVATKLFMTKFVTKIYSLIKAREAVEQLFINDNGVLDTFEKSLTGTTYLGEFKGIIKFIEHFANGGSVGKKVKYLRGVKDGITEYEFISKHIRIYAIQQPGKKIVVFCGMKRKADSSDNIAVFRSIKKEYSEFIKLHT